MCLCVCVFYSGRSTLPTAILVTPLGGLSVIVSAVLAAVMLNEKLELVGKLGCGLCVLGSTVIVLNCPSEREMTSVDEITMMMKTNLTFQVHVCMSLSVSLPACLVILRLVTLFLCPVPILCLVLIFPLFVGSFSRAVYMSRCVCVVMNVHLCLFYSYVGERVLPPTHPL